MSERGAAFGRRPSQRILPEDRRCVMEALKFLAGVAVFFVIFRMWRRSRDRRR